MQKTSFIFVEIATNKKSEHKIQFIFQDSVYLYHKSVPTLFNKKIGLYKFIPFSIKIENGIFFI
jgi:hypothetical protein